VDIADASFTQQTDINMLSTFNRISEANLTLRGCKCHIALSLVFYLGHVFSSTGMSPYPCKVTVVRDWATPTSVEEVRKFIGLASYYHHYIQGFSDIANLLIPQSSLLLPLGSHYQLSVVLKPL